MKSVHNHSNSYQDNQSEKRKPLVVLLGPTAVGKTEISIQLAERLKGEIVSADSRLFYRGLNIGTAKPTPDEMERVPHHLVDIAEPDEKLSLAVFQELAYRAIAGVHGRGNLPILVGGAGQYVRAVVEGWQPPTISPDARLRKTLEAWARQIGAQELHDRLAVVDPAAAARIDYRNLRRTIRALEVILSTGQRFSEQRTRSPSPYESLLLGLIRPRAVLYERIDARIREMLEGGLVDEVRGLLDRGYSPDLPALSAIGYQEISAYLRGRITLEEAERQMRRNTRIFVRRQSNWFKANDPRIHWFDVGVNTVTELKNLIRDWLSALNENSVPIGLSRRQEGKI
jgi:tRNA dimethylallyltransferase